MHVEPPVHVTPQPPQLFESVAVLTQLAPHRASPVGHAVTHPPFEQS